ncbi:hypothetical protein PI95_000835 [Hassallia byssoidea VB512170]|uniref:Uncharacterized protein n=1 Tax=Hassallia byssoidea VB512170 TaxID=1304833 RepID=A0A846H1S6_9CYAN|nr:hypothetical protein [Hassalia byssoidea]NEU71158.1 hypothetical protein [Hassalia byssoidea VB512170]
MAEAIALAHVVKVSCRRSHRIRDVGFRRSRYLHNTQKLALHNGGMNRRDVPTERLYNTFNF